MLYASFEGVPKASSNLGEPNSFSLMYRGSHVPSAGHYDFGRNDIGHSGM